MLGFTDRSRQVRLRVFKASFPSSFGFGSGKTPSELEKSVLNAAGKKTYAKLGKDLASKIKDAESGAVKE